MWTAILGACLLSLPVQTDDGATGVDVAPGEPPELDGWLVISGVDGRGRRPLRPDAVFEAHLLDPGAAAPVEGQQLAGERGTGTWTYSASGEGGGPEARGSYAFGELEIAPEEAGVYLARLSGAWQLFVNGRPQVGDAYRYGFGGLPVELVAGTNRIAVTGARGGFELGFSRPAGELVLEARDLTVPDVVVGETAPISIGVPLHRTAAAGLSGARIEVTGDLEGSATLEPLAPLETRVAALELRPTDARRLREPGSLACELTVRGRDGAALVATSFTVEVVAHDAKRLQSFRSRVDGSTQVWGEVPPLDDDTGALPGLVLSLHGASVPPRNQIGAYGRAPGLWIVAPTNRRPYGFDWQDWGRTDAYEVRDAFVGREAVSATRRYLTGHSMGGHGTWHLAANDPDQWAVVAPSAGWRSFDTYGSRPEGTLTEWWQRADAASHTEAAIGNLRALPTFVLHGDADRTVPADEARAMLALLEAEDAVDVRSHFEPGAGHWWDGDPAPGAACVQWPDMFAMFDEYDLPSELERELSGAVPAELDFRTVDPAVDSRHHWVEVLEVRTIGRPAGVRATAAPADHVHQDVDGTTIQPRVPAAVETENVAVLAVDSGPYTVDRLTVDGQELAVGASGRIVLARSGGAWRVAAGGRDPGRRRPGRSGPFKRAFENQFVLVRGTAGEPAETRALLDLARYHAAEWWYRANGRALLMTDEQFLGRSDLAHRNVILYGNAETNAAWDAVLEPDCPVRVRRGGVFVEDLFLRGADRAALFVQRRRGSDRALVGVFGAASPRAARLLLTSAPFVSGVGIPDFLIFDSGVLAEGDDAAIVTGFWDHDWRYDETNQTGL